MLRWVCNKTCVQPFLFVNRAGKKSCNCWVFDAFSAEPWLRSRSLIIYNLWDQNFDFSSKTCVQPLYALFSSAIKRKVAIVEFLSSYCKAAFCAERTLMNYITEPKPSLVRYFDQNCDFTNKICVQPFLCFYLNRGREEKW